MQTRCQAVSGKPFGAATFTLKAPSFAAPKTEGSKEGRERKMLLRQRKGKEKEKGGETKSSDGAQAERGAQQANQSGANRRAEQFKAVDRKPRKWTKCKWQTLHVRTGVLTQVCSVLLSCAMSREMSRYSSVVGGCRCPDQLQIFPNRYEFWVCPPGPCWRDIEQGKVCAAPFDLTPGPRFSRNRGSVLLREVEPKPVETAFQAKLCSLSRV